MNHPASLPPTDLPHEGITVLVVDDEEFNRLMLEALLESQGYRVLQAPDGEQAIALFESGSVDIVLMDIEMPGMNGYQATRRIKAALTDEHLPVIFLTASTDDEALAQCVESGGDGFLTKPYSHVVLNAKIQAQLRIRQLYQTVNRQNHALRAHRLQEQQDQELANRIYSRIVHLNCLDDLNIPYSTSPLAMFNGDLLLAGRTCDGCLRLMLGDFTGHGLPAAVGAIPTAEIFYTMTRNGYDLSEVISAINDKLNAILPTGFFCAAAFVEMDFREHAFRIWTGGLPDILLYGGEPRRIRERFSTCNLPLGIVGSDQMDTGSRKVHCMEEDVLLLYTDGLTETLDQDGEQYGDQRLEDLILGTKESEWVSPCLLRGLESFRGDMNRCDDTSLVEIPCQIDGSGSFINTPEHHQRVKASTHWQGSLKLDADALRNTDPIPTLLQLLNDIQGLKPHRSELFTILAELFNNALHHGVLQLDSGMKDSAEGFMAYYEEQSRRLENLQTGSILIELAHTPLDEGGRLLIRVTDSGEGFDFRNCQTGLQENTGTCGRGIPLLRAMCSQLRYLGKGNVVEAEYIWK